MISLFGARGSLSEPLGERRLVETTIGEVYMKASRTLTAPLLIIFTAMLTTVRADKDEGHKLPEHAKKKVKKEHAAKRSSASILIVTENFQHRNAIKCRSS